VVILGLLLAFGLVFILILGNMLTPVFAGIVIAYLLDGLVERLARLRIPRKAAVLFVFILFMTVLLVLFGVLLPLLSKQVVQLVQELPSMIASGQKLLALLPERYPELVTDAQIRQLIGSLRSEATKLAQQILSISVASIRGVISILIYLVLVPLLVFSFLKDKDTIIQWLKEFLPEQHGLAVEVWHEVNQQIYNYIRGKLWEIIIVWGISFITFRLLNLNFSMLLSLFVGLSVLVPYIGATVMFFPVGLIGYFQWGLEANFFYALLAYAIIQALDGNLLAPLLLSEVVNLHPVAIIVAVLMFGGLWGIWGLLFAVPLGTLVHAVIKAWFRSRKRVQESAGSQPV